MASQTLAMTQLSSLCPGHPPQRAVRAHELTQPWPAAMKKEARQGARCSNGQANTRPPPQFLTGIRDIALSGKYEAWILDQFGVLHDGKKAYPEAISTLRELARQNVKLVLLSNSSRPSAVTRKKLPSLGFDPDLFHAVITSGELTQRSLLKREDPWFQSLGTKCLHMTWTTRGGVTLEGLGLEVVGSVEEAEFVLAHGTEGIASPDGTVQAASMEELEAVLRQAAELSRARGQALPLIIANPDFVTVEERALRVMPGTLGKLYAEMGGEVKCMGKPDPIVFQESCMLTGVPPEKAIMVGDSLHHDIVGANHMGIDSLFVCGGIHASDLGIVSIDDLPEPAALESLCQHEGIWPTYATGMFQW